MISKSNVSSRKLRGGYYTPSFVAQYLWDWVKVEKPRTILEPSAGDGALIEPSKREHNNIVKFTAIEIIKSEAKKLGNRFPKNVHVINDDFYKWFHNNQKVYDAVIANPPYIRYQYLSNKQRTIQSRIMESCGFKANRLINAWVTFVVASLKILKRGGRAGFVLPNDLLQVSYARPLRYYLSTILDKMYLVTFNKGVFKNLQQDVVLLLCEKKSLPNQVLSFKHITSINYGKIPKWTTYPNVKLPNLSDRKWNMLNLNGNALSTITKLKKDSIPFYEMAEVNVGITTGANSFFSLNQKKVDQMKAKNYVIPLLCRSTSVKDLNFNKQSLRANEKANKKTWLLLLNNQKYNQLPKSIQKYLDEGKAEGINQRYKLKIRKYWYHIPSIWSPDMFLLRRIGIMPHLVANSIGAVSTDTFHRVKLLYSNINKWTFIFAFYSSLTQISIELAGRHFGGGALEILPGDTADIYMPDIDYHYKGLVKEFAHLNNLIVDTKYIQASKYVDKILEKKFKVTYNSDKLLKILKSLRQSRLK